jgi:hypothetical protein
MIRGLDSTYNPPDGGTLLARLAVADGPAEHLWCVTAVWRIPDPRTRDDTSMLLDVENMIGFGGTGCFKCEQAYSEQLAAQPCTGSIG